MSPCIDPPDFSHCGDYPLRKLYWIVPAVVPFDWTEEPGNIRFIPDVNIPIPYPIFLEPPMRFSQPDEGHDE